jgi:phospholipid transport system substrate-binding protein
MISALSSKIGFLVTGCVNAAKVVLCLLILCVGVAPDSARADAEGARMLIQNLGKDATALINNTTLPPYEKQFRLTTMFEKAVDIDWVSRFVIGRYWSQITPAQNEAYVRNYRSFLINNYTSRFEEFKDASVVVKSAQPNGVGEYLVKSAITIPSKPVILVDYRVRENAAQYKIIDMQVEGVSLLSTQRSEFASVIQRKGVQGFIDLLGNKARQLSARKN